MPEFIDDALFEKIERAKQEWEVTLDALPQLILLIDQHGVIQRANRTLERWNLGRVISVKGVDLHEQLHPSCDCDDCTLDQLIKGALTDGSLEHMYYDPVLERYIQIEILPAANAGILSEKRTVSGQALQQLYAQESVLSGPQHNFAVIIHDVTEQQQAAEQLRQMNDALQQALQTRQEMLQNVSHELRTPLTLIQGFANLLQSGGLGPVNEDQDEAITILVDKSQELQRLIERLLMLQRLDVQIKRRTPWDVEALLAQTIKAWQSQADEKSIQIEMVHTHPAPVSVSVHVELMTEALGNLVENAIKFSPERSTIVLETEVDADSVIVSISDQGPGIPPEQQQQIFEEFYQVNGSSTRSIGGVGIGLTLCRKIIQRHGGEIWLQTAGEQDGCTFSVKIPLSE